MYRILWIAVLFVLIVPFVWKLVQRVLMRIESKWDSPEFDADEINEKRKALVEDLNNRKKKAEDMASEAEKAKDKLK